jgi:DNA-binding GntR family transcriptional regulator
MPIKEKLVSDDGKEQFIVDSIYEAVIDQRLAPGTKLSEAALCDSFGVGRMHIRRSLLVLASREVIELQPNKGAFVACPTAKQARDIFEARLSLEPPLANLAAQRVKKSDIKSLEKHLLQESAAHNSGNRREAIRLSGQFHNSLALAANNEVMIRIVKDLVARSSLIIGMFGDSGISNCRDDEHAGIVQALRSADGKLAEKLMAEHLIHIKDHLNLDRPKGGATDLVSLFKLHRDA